MNITEQRTTIDVSSDNNGYFVNISAERPSHVRIRVQPHITAFRLVVERGGCDVEIAYSAVRSLSVQLGDGRELSHAIARLLLNPTDTTQSQEKCFLTGNGIGVDEIVSIGARVQIQLPVRLKSLVLHGGELDSGDIDVESCAILGHVGVVGNPRIGTLTLQSAESVLRPAGQVTVGGLGSDLTVEGGEVSGDFSNHTVLSVGAVIRLIGGSDTAITGSGRVEIWGLVDGLKLEGLPLFVRGYATNVEGEISKLDCVDSTLIARDGARMRVARIDAADGSRIEGVDIDSLFGSNLSPLSNCRQFVPRVPSRKELKYLVSSSDNPHESARFWAQMSRLLASQDNTGATQSRVREARDLARLRVADNSERALLWAGRALGFGEKIAQPLAIWVAASVAVGVLLRAQLGWTSSQNDLGEWVKTCMIVLSGPLDLVRVSIPHPNASGLWDSVLYLGAKALGTLCLGASILAGKRRFRPPQN